MPRIIAPNGPFLPPAPPSSNAPSAAPVGTYGVDSYEALNRPVPSRKAGEKANWNLFYALRNGADDGTGVSGVHWVEPTAFMGFTHELPGLKIEFEAGSDVNAVIASIIEEYPEFDGYTFVQQWTTWDFLPKWMTFLKRRPVAVFRLDTAN